ncbi:MAG: response regulator [Planctomycetota bacterium]|jgi:two-component system probable response regulator PhcQ|nr:response regulator [Planctomycetota bacterium]
MSQSQPPGSVILFVDDEDQARKYFYRALAKHYAIATADGVASAKAMIAELGESLGVVITDQRMPQETGVELLTWLRSERPSVVRMLTTAYADLDNAIDAVNDGFVFQYIQKPWDVKELRAILRRALDYHAIHRERDMLLREKLTTLQRMIVVDRVRSFAVLAAGMANRLRNPLLALKTFLDVAPDASDDTPPNGAGALGWDDLWDLARNESSRMLDLVSHILSLTAEPDFHFDDAVQVRHLLDGVDWDLAPQEHLQAGLPALRCDRAMLQRTLAALSARLAAIRGEQLQSLQIDKADSVWGAPGWRVRLTAGRQAFSNEDVSQIYQVLTPLESTSNDDAGSDLLAAYFAAFHHGGSLAVIRESDTGPGFELLIPLDPEASQQPAPDGAWLQNVFALFEA